MYAYACIPRSLNADTAVVDVVGSGRDAAVGRPQKRV